MTVSSELWQANQDLIPACLEHPFVQGIADGTLPRQIRSVEDGDSRVFVETSG